MLNMALHITWFTPINGFTPIMILHTVRDGKAADDPILRIENISKNYGPVQALCGVTTAIRRGAIHGLLGENGAGKSTLVGIISGQVTPTSGRIFMDGRLLEHVDVKAMEEAGVFLVTQEPMIIDKMTTAENLMLGIWPTKNGVIDWKTLRSDAARILDGSGINASTLAGHLDAVARRKLNILRAMFSGGKVIILDEPTAALTVADRRQLFDFMRRLQAAGVTFIFISHYHDEILAICDAVTVLRDGRLAGGSDDIGSMTSVALSEWVIGRGLELFQRIRRDHTGKPPAVSLRGIQGKALSLDRLDIGAGEIVGFTGLPGAGAKESARAILACIRPVAASQLTVRPHRLCRKGHAWPSILALLIFPMTAVVKGGLGRCRSGPISPSLLCLAGEMGGN